MRLSFPLIAALCALLNVTAASAQDPRLSLAQPEHQELQRLVGEWQFERHSVPEDGSEPQALGAGTVSAEMLGDFFVVSRWAGNIFGMDFEGLQVLGYDVEQENYAGHWTDNFLSYRWELSGAADGGGDELTLASAGPSPTGGTTNFRERYRFDSADSITIVGEMQEGEQWLPVTSTRLTRQR